MRSAAIEKPVENISVSTTSRAPLCGGVRDHRGEMREVRLRVFPDDVVLDRGDLHGVTLTSSAGELLQPSDRLVDHLEPLAEREAHERRSRVDVVVEHDVRHGDDAAALGQRPAEREPVGLADRSDVDGDEVRAVPTDTR